MTRTLLMAIVSAFSLTACTVGPNYRAPAVPTPPHFAEAADTPTVAPATPGAGWWHVYRDPELDRLIDLGMRDSPNVAMAVARIAGARATERSARADFLPQVSANGAYNSERFSQNVGLSSLSSLFGGGASGSASGGGSGGGGVAAPGNSIHTYTLGFDANWELDLFGGARRQVEGARARTQAAIWSARDAQLSLIAEIADSYFQLRTLQDRERVARQEVDRQQRNLDIARATARAGLIAQGDFIRERADVAGADAAVGPIVAAGKVAMHAIAVLTGQAPGALIDELSVIGQELPPPPAVPPGLPSDLLRRRPDIRAAERNLAAANADIGVAVADLYPRFTLTGAADLISTALANLFTGDSLQLAGSAAAAFPVLDFGRRSETVGQRRAVAEQAYQQYRLTVLGALRDVEDALIRIRTERQRHAALARGLADASRGEGSVTARWQSGLVDYGDVLLARAAVYQLQDTLAQSDGAQRRDLLSLYKALGGGWEALPLDTSPKVPDGAAYSAPRP